MTEAVTNDRPPVANGTATVSASALALHLDCSRTYVGKLEAEGVIQRQGDGFPLDQSRVAYLRYLRRERQQSPRSEADADHVKVKTEMLQLRLMEKKRELVRRGEVDALIDGIAGVVLTHLSGMAARCSNDLMVRRKIDAVVYEVRKEMAKVALEMADKNGGAKAGGITIGMRIIFLGELYSGPTFQPDGTIVIKNVPTVAAPVPVVELSIGGDNGERRAFACAHHSLGTGCSLASWSSDSLAS